MYAAGSSYNSRMMLKGDTKGHRLISPAFFEKDLGTADPPCREDKNIKNIITVDCQYIFV